MRLSDITRRIRERDPLVVDSALAIALTVLTCVLAYLLMRVPPGNAPALPNLHPVVPEHERPPAALAYLLIAGTFLPLAVRRKTPWIALAVSAASMAAYQLTRGLPPAPLAFGPMLAMYSFAAYSRRRHAGLLVLVAAGLAIAVPVFAFSSSVRWVANLVGAFALLAAAALLGEAARNRREYVEAVEMRALQAERTREEEARRRVDEERIRIARDVHDIVAHSLSIVTVQAGAAATLLERDPAQARQSIEHIRATSKQALSELRSMLDVLRTAEGGAPLAPAADLSQVATLVDPLREAGLAVDLDVYGDLASLPAFMSVSGYRIVQEALTNVVRHAQAASVRVSVAVTASQLVIEIIDDGTGSPREQSQTPGHGIQGMRERVEALGGAFQARPAAERGFRVFAAIPLARGAL
ncbi:MAG: sensor histidine kinase [Actinomycetia bacterium]|nr:sensor histidine kinase [Actinomycetes bacterium]